MSAPVIEKLEGVSLNYYWFSKKTVQLPSPVFSNIVRALVALMTPHLLQRLHNRRFTAKFLFEASKRHCTW
jgi:hypothetical protein